MPQRIAAAGTSCVFEGTHRADGGALPERKRIQVPSRWRDDAREGTGAHLGSGSVTPIGVKRLQEPALQAGGRLGTASARSIPARLARLPCAKASDVRYIG